MEVEGGGGWYRDRTVNKKEHHDIEMWLGESGTWRGREGHKVRGSRYWYTHELAEMARGWGSIYWWRGNIEKPSKSAVSLFELSMSKTGSRRADFGLGGGGSSTRLMPPSRSERSGPAEANTSEAGLVGDPLAAESTSNSMNVSGLEPCSKKAAPDKSSG